MREWLIEYWEFIRENKSYWLIPMMLVLGLVGGLVVLAKGSVISPFIYTLF